MKIRPLLDWLVVRLEPIPSETPSGIILVDGSASERVRMGTVLRAGPGRWSTEGPRIPIDIKEGDRVAFFRENLEHQQGKQLMRVLEEIEDDVGMIRANDILYVETAP